MRTFKLACVILFSATGCDAVQELYNCDDEMRDARDDYGDPEETRNLSSDGFNNVSWWWWSQGIQKSFAWGSNAAGGCDVFTFTFDPIEQETH